MSDQLVPVPLVTPGFKGLNKAQASVPDLDPGWAIECQNFIFDQSGRLASRQGWGSLTVTPVSFSVTFSGAPVVGSTSQVLSGNWGNPSGTYGIVFSDGEIRQGTFTSGSTACTWLLPLTGSPTVTATARPAIQSVGELALANGTSFVVSAGGNKLYSGTTVLTDITGSLTITANNWQWVTFNGAIYGAQSGHPLIMWNGTGTFAVNPVTAGTAPTGGSCILAAFGRLWVLDSDNQTIQYSALLDSTTWNGVSAGSVNMATVWTRGIDQVIGLGAAGSKLVVFGTKQIIIYADSAGSILGLNPQNLYVYDTVEGTGLAARDTIQSTGEGDLTFLSPTGVQSIQRLLSSGKDNPVASLDKQVHDYFNGYFLSEVPAAVRSAYSPLNRFYVILLPVAGRAFCYDTRQPLQDGSLRVTEWPSVTWSSILNQKSGNVLYGEYGQVGQYGGYTDNLAAFTIVYNSPNLALGNGGGEGSFENRMKILKRLKAVLFYGGTTVATFSWGVDFLGLNQTYQVSLGGILSEYGIAQYGINEYGGGAGISVQGFPLSNSGRWLQFGLTASINGYQLAIQQLDAFVKIGNMI